jgi:hypothetical protein
MVVIKHAGGRREKRLQVRGKHTEGRPVRRSVSGEGIEDGGQKVDSGLTDQKM